MNRTPQLILLPGLGADHRLLEPQRREFPDLIVPPWFPPRKNQSLADYAAQMAEVVGPLRAKRLVLGGVSFGGMLAYEMARHLKPDAVVLIASCRNRRGLRWICRAGRPLLPLTPVQVWDVAKLLSQTAMRVRSRIPPPDRDILITMFKEMDSRFMHWVVQAILGWNPAPLEGVPVFQIHGRRDLLIPARRVEADAWIPDGGHLINMTHAREVNAFIRGALEPCR
jgi:pimeloyl-ACP methyl ester carboxylesterase